MLAANGSATMPRRCPPSGRDECRTLRLAGLYRRRSGTFRAVLCGAPRHDPETYDRDAATAELDALAERRYIMLGIIASGRSRTAIIAEKGKRLPGHPNYAMQFRLLKAIPTCSRRSTTPSAAASCDEAELAWVGRRRTGPRGAVSLRQRGRDAAFGQQSGRQHRRNETSQRGHLRPGTALDDASLRSGTSWIAVSIAASRPKHPAAGSTSSGAPPTPAPLDAAAARMLRPCTRPSTGCPPMRGRHTRECGGRAGGERRRPMARRRDPGGGPYYLDFVPAHRRTRCRTAAHRRGRGRAHHVQRFVSGAEVGCQGDVGSALGEAARHLRRARRTNERSRTRPISPGASFGHDLRPDPRARQVPCIGATAWARSGVRGGFFGDPCEGPHRAARRLH